MFQICCSVSKLVQPFTPSSIYPIFRRRQFSLYFVWSPVKNKLSIHSVLVQQQTNFIIICHTKLSFFAPLFLNQSNPNISFVSKMLGLLGLHCIFTLEHLKRPAINLSKCQGSERYQYSVHWESITN